MARTMGLMVYNEGRWRVVGKAAPRRDRPSGNNAVGKAAPRWDGALAVLSHLSAKAEEHRCHVCLGKRCHMWATRDGHVQQCQPVIPYSYLESPIKEYLWLIYLPKPLCKLSSAMFMFLRKCFFRTQTSLNWVEFIIAPLITESENRTIALLSMTISQITHTYSKYILTIWFLFLRPLLFHWDEKYTNMS